MEKLVLCRFDRFLREEAEKEIFLAAAEADWIFLSVGIEVAVSFVSASSLV